MEDGNKEYVPSHCRTTGGVEGGALPEGEPRACTVCEKSHAHFEDGPQTAGCISAEPRSCTNMRKNPRLERVRHEH